MYLPAIDPQVPVLELHSENIPPVHLPNVTKEIGDVLRLCDTAGLDPHGLGCGMSIAVVLILTAALLFGIVAVLIPAIVSLIVGIAAAFAKIIAVITVGFVALILGFFGAIATTISVICRGIVKILSLPFRPCLGHQDPVSPLESPGTGGVVDGQIRYVRESQPEGRPPSYHSDEEVGATSSQTVK